MELDADDWLKDDALEVLVNEMKKQPNDVALQTGNVIHVYEKNGKVLREKLVRTIFTEGRSFKQRYDIVKSNYIPYPRFYRTSCFKK